MEKVIGEKGEKERACVCNMKRKDKKEKEKKELGFLSLSTNGASMGITELRSFRSKADFEK